MGLAQGTLGRGSGLAQFSQTLPLQAMGAVSGLLGGLPMYQPTFGPSPGQNFLSFMGPILSAYASQPGGGKGNQGGGGGEDG